MELFDLKKFDSYQEDNRMEVKKANDGLPVSMWETYSAFANSSGGVIILGVKEKSDGSWETSGLKNEKELLKSFWNTINNPNKISENLLTDKDVQVFEKDGDTILVINVPKASREQKPVYINGDMFKGTYRRNHEGDFKCSVSAVKAMLRDETESTSDMKVLEDFTLEDLNQNTIKAYRNYFNNGRIGHPWSELPDNQFLECLGAAVCTKNGIYHPTAAGLLMFGNEYKIVREYPEYFLDYREEMDTSFRWTDRLQSSSGDWSGNLFDFFFMVYNKIQLDIKKPFKLNGVFRVDDTPIHKAIREAFANCLINADYYEPCGIVIKKDNIKVSFENPGYIRTGKQQMLKGGVSDPRNKALMKMFNLIDIGERAGSGVPGIFMTWANAGFSSPVVEECFEPDRTRITLFFEESTKITEKTTEKTTEKQKTAEKILDLVAQNSEITTEELAEECGVVVDTIDYHIKNLKKKNKLVRNGGKKGGRWEVL